jgi:hypothetical protein
MNIEHQPQSGVGSNPVTVGKGYSTIAWIPEPEGSWALPLLHERITSFENLLYFCLGLALLPLTPNLAEIPQAG